MISGTIGRWIAAVLGTGVWGIVHFVTAIPGGRGLGLPVWLSALAAVAGYALVTAVVVVAGEGLRCWLMRRFGLKLEPDPTKLLWKVWLRGGLPWLALLAPITCGPYIAAVIALGLGERPWRTWLWIVAGVVPWAAALAVLTALGASALTEG